MRLDGNKRQFSACLVEHGRPKDRSFSVVQSEDAGNGSSFGIFSADRFAQLLDTCKKSRSRSQALHLYTCMPLCVLKDHEELANELVVLLAEVGSTNEARHVFDRLLHKGTNSWSSLIIGYTRGGNWKHALTLFQIMEIETSFFPNDYAFLSLLKACIQLNDVKRGSDLHALAVSKGLLKRNIFIGSALVDMYIKCGSMSKAEDIFYELPDRDVVLWTTLIAGYVDNARAEEAILCFKQMHREGCSPNAHTLACLSEACGCLKSICKGEEIHTQIVMKGYECQVIVSNSLLSMYATCGFLETSKMLLKRLLGKNVVSWTAMIDGYVEHGDAEQALNCYERMQYENIASNALTLSCSVKACSSLGAIEKGRKLHAEIMRRGFESEIQVGGVLVSLYVKTGALVDAKYVFDELPVRDSILWSALIAGYSQVGESRNAFSTFNKMLIEFSNPNLGNCANVLNACNYDGQLEQGLLLFGAIQSEYGLIPNIEHYTTIVDLLGRSGNTKIALLIIEDIPYHPDYILWCTLLTASQKNNFEVASYAFDNAVKLNAKGMSAYVSMCNIYTDAAMYNKAREIKALWVQNTDFWEICKEVFE